MTLRRLIRIPICWLLASLATGLSAGEPAPVTAYRQAHEAEILRDFSELLSIPNVASDTPNIRRNAEYLRRQLEERGARAELWQLDGAPPIVFGELDVSSAPEVPSAPLRGDGGDETERTLGIYVHYDGQPVNAEKWTHPPFEPTLYTAAIESGGRRRPFPEPGEATDPEWRIYARAAGDDKAPFPALFTALDALNDAGIARTSNLKFLFEGEEEAGSPHLGDYLQRYRDRLDVDAWLICDGPVHQSRRPQLVFGVRGVTGFEITVYGATRYLHSGHYGNWAPNPAHLLARLLATMKDDDGRVLIEGFYDSTVLPGEAERAAIATLPDFDGELRRELGLAATEGDASLAERLLLPSLNIRGFVSGAVGSKGRNVIPNQATASLDVRLAKGNDPEAMLDLVEAHVRRQGYHVVRQDPDLETRLAHPKIARIERREGYKAARTSMDLPIVRDVIAAAERAAAPEPMVLLPTLGGSLPLYLFTEVLARPVVIVPIANHDDNQHAPDENLRLANLWYGIDLMAALLTMD